MKPTMNWRIDVVSEEYYNALVGSGYAWEMYPDLPLSWKAVKEEIRKFNEDVQELNQYKQNLLLNEEDK